MSKIITDLAAPVVHTPEPDLAPMGMVREGVDPLDHALGKQVLEILCTHYPGWFWRVEIPRAFYGNKQNIVIIRNTDTNPRGDPHGYVLHKSELSGANLNKSVMRAGGEILERYRMRRAAFREEEIADRQMLVERPDS